MCVKCTYGGARLIKNSLMLLCLQRIWDKAYSALTSEEYSRIEWIRSDFNEKGQLPIGAKQLWTKYKRETKKTKGEKERERKRKISLFSFFTHFLLFEIQIGAFDPNVSFINTFPRKIDQRIKIIQRSFVTKKVLILCKFWIHKGFRRLYAKKTVTPIKACQFEWQSA